VFQVNREYFGNMSALCLWNAAHQH